jgi:hypothetical protein
LQICLEFSASVGRYLVAMISPDSFLLRSKAKIENDNEYVILAQNPAKNRAVRQCQAFLRNNRSTHKCNDGSVFQLLDIAKSERIHLVLVVCKGQFL